MENKQGLEQICARMTLFHTNVVDHIVGVGVSALSHGKVYIHLTHICIYMYSPYVYTLR